MVERYKMWSFSEMIEALESHFISCALKQLPSMIAQSVLPSKSNDSFPDETKADQDAKEKLFGRFANKK